MAAPTSTPLSTGDTFWADADRHLIRYAGTGAFKPQVTKQSTARWDSVVTAG
jgi:2,2-dialkylglycine decarboxylase (pyruvate)